ncbi:MAG: TonB-dependent receptor plug domain-containing protein [Treponema sp.]|jgi:hypothetical protein|nr:TonB-dependent receptor plug domain-containing protein [Treponema sp.]
MPAKLSKKLYSLFAVFLLACLIPLHARDIVITVEDTDLGLPLEGALIRSWDGGEHSCDEAGRATITVPDDRQVVIQVAYPGYENGRLVIPLRGDSFSLGLRLSGVMENRELVIEAQRPGISETKSGRSVAISGEDLARTAEIGIIEDVMTSIKLLPGVGYTGMFNALPSIRGGEPGDLTAVMDGFYIEQPYHWGGGVSIFDPRMVQSAQLSHGVFSTRYGHTISGLLEVTSKKASATETELELGISSSATNLNLSVPLRGKGGIMVMGKVTYWDPFVWAAQQLSTVVDDETLDQVNAVSTAPYIRSSAFSVNYRFTPEVEWTMGGFIGGDGVGAAYDNDSIGEDGLPRQTDLHFNWNNMLGFLNTRLIINPLPSMVLKTTLGAGFSQADLYGDTYNNITVPYSGADFIAEYGPLLSGDTYSLDQHQRIGITNTTVNYQGRVDLDWDLGKGFLFGLGFQELYSKWILQDTIHGIVETAVHLPVTVNGQSFIIPYVNYPVDYTIDVSNQGFTSSGYTLLEYASPNKRIGGELGLRLDHVYFIGKDFTIQTTPALNPRINLDFGILRNKGILDSLTATIGTGLFSSMTDNISQIQRDNGIDDFEMKQNRSWTSVVGTKFDFMGGFSFNIEGYVKYVFDRAYSLSSTDSESQTRSSDYLFDGEGRIWGFDLMLQKFESRYWDGWISYSFTHARYRNPQAATVVGDDESEQGIWYYPWFQRFHNLNLILNIKPVKWFNIAIRFGLASGRPKNMVGEIKPYLVQVRHEDGTISYIEKYKREAYYSDNERTTWSIPLDLKFSWFLFDLKGKGQAEIYFAIENLLSLVYKAQANTSFNSYTGEENTGSNAAAYELPIPMPSIGFKWTY